MPTARCVHTKEEPNDSVWVWHTDLEGLSVLYNGLTTKTEHLSSYLTRAPGTPKKQQSICVVVSDHEGKLLSFGSGYDRYVAECDNHKEAMRKLGFLIIGDVDVTEEL